MAPQKKLSVAEAQQWVLNAIAHLEQLPEDPKELTQEFFDETRPVDFKEPKKPRVSKKKSSTSSDISERSEEGYDCMRCDARATKKQKGMRFDFQCSHSKLDGECFCKNHLRQFNSSKGLELGKVTEERPTHWADGKAIAWHDADPELLETLKKKTKKKKEVDPDAPKKQRKCGLCGEVGHTKRTCPKVDKKPESPKVEETVQEVLSEILDKVVPPETPVLKTPVPESPKVEETVGEVLSEIVDKVVPETLVLESPVPETPVPELKGEESIEDDGKGTGLVPLQLEEDDSNTEPLSEYSDDSEEEEDNIPFLFEGIQYEREPSGDQTVFDDEGDTVGKWNGEEITFLSASLKMEHAKKVTAISGIDSTPKSTTSEELLEMAKRDLRKMAKSYGISADDIDDADDTDDPKVALVKLIKEFKQITTHKMTKQTKKTHKTTKNTKKIHKIKKNTKIFYVTIHILCK